MGQDRLSAAHDRLAVILQHLPDVVVYETGAGHEYISTNVVTLLGYEAEEFSRDRTIFPSLLHPDDDEKTRAALQAWSRAGRHGPCVTRFRVRHKDGRWVWLEDRMVQVKETTGRGYMSGVLIDVTDQMRIEGVNHTHRLLLEEIASEASLGDVLESLVMSVETQCEGLLCSILLADADRTHLVGSIAPSLPKEYSRLVEGMLIGEGMGSCGTAAARRERVIVTDIAGDPLWDQCRELASSFSLASCWSEPILTPEGELLGTFAMYYSEPRVPEPREIEAIESAARFARLAILRRREEMKRIDMERQLLHAQKLESLGVLAGGIAHDFNNLLAGVLGYSDMALKRLDPAHEAFDKIQRVRESALRAADLTRQLLAYSGKGKFIVGPVNVGELVTEMTHLLEVSVSKKAALRFDIGLTPVWVNADATQLRQIVMNLITNASEALLDAPGDVRVSTGAVELDADDLSELQFAEGLVPGNYVFVEVADTGCGMSGETLGRIFDPFFTTKFAGRGLGLAAVMGIVRAHKGAMRVESGEGRGSTFRVLLPLLEGYARDPNAVPSTRGIGRPTDTVGGHILVVDDDELLREIAQEVLEDAGFTVTLAVDGADGVEKYAKSEVPVDAVLLDMTMPKLNGDETYRELRKIKPDVRVVLSSGYNQQDAVGRFSGAGLSGFIQKPYVPDDLVAKMRGALRRRRAAETAK